MATLEKIRSKSVLLLIIVGAALLAFIIGDFFTSSRTLFGTGTTIAKVGKQKVDVQEFQRRVQEAQQAQQNQGQHTDAAVLQQQVLEQMLAEKLMNEEVERLGITVTDSELSDMMLGKNSAFVDRMVQQQYGLGSAAEFHDMAFNPGKYNIPQDQAVQFQQAWIALEKNVEQMLLQQKFQNLFSGTLTANDLDARALYDDAAPTAKAIYVKKDFGALADADFSVEAADINKLYDSERARYALDEPTRLVEYITVNIIPSQADQAAGQRKVEDALKALNESANTDVAALQNFVVEKQTISQSNVDRQARLKAVLDTLSPGRAALVSRNGNDYELARLNSKDQASEKVVVDFMAIMGNKAQADSLIALLNGGAAFDSIATSELVAGTQKAQEISLLGAQAGMVKELIEGRATGVYFTPDTLADAQQYRIMRVAERPAPVTVYDLTTASFTIEPSAATVNELEAKLQNYLTTHKTAAEFADSAQAAGYATFPAYVTPSSAMLGNLPDSHAAVAWAMDAKKGEVSPIFGDVQSGRFMAVALENIYKDYMPAGDPQLNASLTMRARNEKKAEKLLADYAGKAKDIAGYAQLMGVSADTTTVNFSQFLIPGIGGNESEVQGRVAAAKKGDLVGPVKANNSVVALQIIEIDNEGRPYNFDESAIRFNQQRGAAGLGRHIDRILIGKEKVDNKMTTFYK